ncbi:MAG TPA: hypothetical protein VHX63_12280 [Acidobacteriaceae bacterium]|nr:hypothetical protein [Acidobacteriaceae bacterium]
MSTQPNTHTPLMASMETAARAAGLAILGTTTGADFHGAPTTRFTFGSSSQTTAGHTLQLELTEAFDFNKPTLLPEMTSHLRESALRLRNPRPDCDVTLAGMPIRFADFAWPFHLSTSGADTHIVHGTVHLEDGQHSPLHAKVSASMTVTFAEIVPAPEQPYAENFIYNAIRKTLDQGQMEMVKSGNRQPVPVTTRYYSRWQKKFLFTETTDASRMEFLALKAYWLSGVLGGNQPIWIADPRDAQYLNTSVEELRSMAAGLASNGALKLIAGTDNISKEHAGEFAAATPELMQHADHYNTLMHAALDLTKPAFNEEMRHGHTNM